MRSRKIVWVNDLVLHVYLEGERIYKNTNQRNSWVIQHDALSAWWDPNAQALLDRLGMSNRQVRARGPNTASTLVCDELDADNNFVRRHEHPNLHRSKMMGDSPELMPLDRHLFNDLKHGCRLNVGATRWLPEGDIRKFLFNTPANAWVSLCRTWEHTPSSERIVEDIEEYFRAVDQVVETRGTFVELNYHNGRRADFFKTAVPNIKEEAGDVPLTKTPRNRYRGGNATMDGAPVHPDARWCLDMEMEFASAGKISGDGSSTSNLEPMLKRDDDDEVFTALGPLFFCKPGEFPGKYEAHHSLVHIWKHEQKLVAEREQKRKKSVADKAEAKKRKAEEKKNKPKAGPKKNRSKAKPKLQDDGLPPVNHRISYHWPSGAAKGWYDATFKGATTNEDGEVECQIEDADGLVNMYGVELQDLAWHLLYYCPHCKMDTKGARVCGKCKDFRDEDDDGEGGDDENF